MSKNICLRYELGGREIFLRQDEALDAVAEDEHRDHRERHRQDRIDAELLEQEVRHIGAEHDERGMGEIDDAHHAPHHGEADGGQTVQAAEQNAVYRRLCEHAIAV